ncbi:MAG: GHKL domain-containing protein [Planctomycetaceae bacterium]|nr:GHKL domain-containing protein [Planctomycetaceae bacterium]
MPTIASPESQAIRVSDVIETLAVIPQIQSSRKPVDSSESAGLRGNMLAAIAHEVNQPLYAIKNYSLAALATLRQIERDEATADGWYDKLRNALDTIAGQVERGSRIVAELKSLAGQNRQFKNSVDLHEVVRRAVESIRLRSDFDDHLIILRLNASQTLVQGEELQLELVLGNLILNAIDAARNQEPERKSIEICTSSDGKDFLLQVFDEGCGVDEDAIPTLFEPYVTHKAHGLGMGLTICRDIIRSHNGNIGCQRRQPVGTEFFINLPLA